MHVATLTLATDPGSNAVDVRATFDPPMDGNELDDLVVALMEQIARAAERATEAKE